MFWDANRSSKVMSRDAALDVNTKKKCIFLPGAGCADVRQAIELGIINNKTKVYLYERNRHAVKLINDYLSNWPFETVPDFYTQDIWLCPVPEKVDFAFFDLMGNLTEESIYWLTYFADCLSDKSDVYFTFCLNMRGNEFTRREISTKEFTEEFQEYKKRYRSEVVASQLLLLDSIFKGYNVRRRLMSYRDDVTGVKMCLVKLNLRKKKMSEGKMIVEMMMTADTPSAKSKATRALNKYLDKRESEGASRKQVRAGIESWITRMSKTKTAKKK